MKATFDLTTFDTEPDLDRFGFHLGMKYNARSTLTCFVDGEFIQIGKHIFSVDELSGILAMAVAIARVEIGRTEVPESTPAPSVIRL